MSQEKNVLFVGVNSSYSHSMLSYGHLRAFTETKVPEWNWSYYETTVKEDVLQLLSHVIDLKPDVITATLYLFNYEYVLGFVKRIRQLLPKTRIILGGPEFHGDNEQFLKTNLEIDAVMRGDETSFYKFLRSDPLQTVEGLCYLNDCSYKDNGTSKYSDKLNDLPSPYKHGYFRKDKPFIQIETSRGCYGTCNFCTSAISNEVNFFSIERIKEDLEYIREAGIHEIRVIDRTFNLPKERALKLTRLFRDEFSDMNFHLELNPALVDDELLNEFKQSRHHQFHIEVGVQSCDPVVLKAITRSTPPEKQLSGIKKLIDADFAEVHTDLIAGLPDQTYDSMFNDVKLLLKVQPPEIQLEVLKMLPGTPFTTSHPDSISWSPATPYEVLETATFPFNKLQKARYVSKMIDNFYNVPELQNLFSYLFISDNSFPENFLEWLIANTDPLLKYSLKKRFEQIITFSKQISAVAYETACFFSLTAGYGSPAHTINLRKIQPDTEHGTVIWKRDSSEAMKRYFEITTATNCADILKSAQEKLKEEPRTYRFYMINGHTTGSIEDIS